MAQVLTKTHTAPKVFGIASGKGGVGKTTIAVNLAVTLSEWGYRTLLLDADTGLSNTHILLGKTVPFNLSHVFEGFLGIEDVVSEVNPFLDLITGTSGIRRMGSLEEEDVAAIVHAVSDLDRPYEIVIVDISAGLSSSVLAFLKACAQQLIVLRDEPAAIADAYGVIKVLASESSLDSVHLIANAVSTQSEGERLHRQFSEVCERFLQHSVDLAGIVSRDPQVSLSQRRKQPLVTMDPGAIASQDIQRIGRWMVKLPHHPPHGGIQFFVDRLVCV